MCAALVRCLLDEEEGEQEEERGEGDFDVEEEAPAVASGEHVAGVEGSGGAPAETDGVDAEFRASFMY